ncbi:holo-ACP synthase [Halomonas caseinilytica]|uniref:Holo-[acyl-carrier-protein] synthase n=1 Tax=Halomonas caseinilytica TaxID=438744 RepID=A0A1M6NB18_9GAMM|nr:holo-ACP synthase [Halomonas caseinilytica]SEM48027.1 holo-[acyl-carrier protein] synthase [Halomonas caseinilytica]SHJ92913.1 holo-[acyl-carrier-protein] synthase [Halomonas caseinilytica]
MIIGVGTDIARVARFERAIARHGERFVERLLGEDERVDFRDRGRSANYLAKRFAAKEAFVKALGTGLRHGMRWTEIQVVNDTLGRPALRLSGRADELARAAGVRSLHVSLSDEAAFAMAFVVLES